MIKFLLFCLTLPVFVTAQSVPQRTGSQLSQDEAQTALDFHNKVRKDVKNESLQWSEELSVYAQEWADELASRNCAFEHRSKEFKVKNYGENIFWGSGTAYTALDASKSWYSEIEKYTHGPLTYDNWYPVGHYTQMVWKNTTHVGIGKSTCSNGAIIIVANYSPPGNYIGQKAYE